MGHSTLIQPKEPTRRVNSSNCRLKPKYNTRLASRERSPTIGQCSREAGKHQAAQNSPNNQSNNAST
jgi:hypothetical protein